MTTLRTDSTHSGITIDYADGSGFVHGGSGPLTVYSNDEKAAINALTDANDDTYYLFLVKNVTKLDADGNRTIVSGYMPVGYQHGFLFGSPAAKYVAHELGHGAFGLHHTFSSETESYNAPQYSTDNLMDYAEGAVLNHRQWRWMHENHGSGLFGFLADESEGEWTTDGHYYLFTYLGMLMGMDYSEAEKLGRYAEEPDSHVFTKDDEETVKMGNDKDVEVYKNYFEEGDVLPAHEPKLVIHGRNDRYYDAKGREICFSDDVSSLHKWNDIILTAEDIFNGYVDIKDKIENFSSDLDIENKTFRLYFKSKAIYVAENTTWSIPELQQRNHALSGGYHGVELAVTAYAIKNAAQLGMQQDVQKYLLHRFGDVFAHFQYDGDEANPPTDLNKSIRYTDRSLSDYIAALDYFFTHNVKYNVPKFYPYDGKIFDEDGIYQDGNMFYSTYSEKDTKIEMIRFLLSTKSTIKRYSSISIKEAIGMVEKWYKHRDVLEIAEEESLQNNLLSRLYLEFKFNYSFSEFSELLKDIINVKARAIQNENVMYGDEVTCMSGWTSGHSGAGTVPDEILQRPELFMLYVRRAAELLNIIKGEEKIQSGVDRADSTIQLAVKWGLNAVKEGNVDVNARLDGVFSFLIECEKHKNDNEFYVYIPIKFLPEEITEGLAMGMYSRPMDLSGKFKWDFTRDAENQRGILEQYLKSKEYTVVDSKTVNKVKDDKNNPVPSHIGLKIKKKNE